VISRVVGLRRDPIGVLGRFAEAQGDVATFRLGRQKVVLVGDPELIRDVLVTNNRKFVKENGLAMHRFRKPRPSSRPGLISSHDMDEHVRGRRIVQPAFAAAAVAETGPAVVRAATQVAERWADGDRIDVDREMSALSIQALAAGPFAAAHVSFEGLHDELARFLDGFSFATSAVFSTIDRLRVLRGLRFMRTLARLDEKVGELLARDGGDASEDRDVPALLNRAESLGAEERRWEAFIIMLAGAETTAAALTWAWWLLAEHPDSEERLHAEADEADSEGRLEAGDSDAVPFAARVFAEAIRLYPPSWFIGRRALEEHRLGEHIVAANEVVLICPYLVHRDARHFSDPDTFVPDRWLDPPPPAATTYLPFGAGPRQCLGERFARLEGALALATIARRWRLRPISSEPVVAEAAASLRPQGGLTMRVESR
jgi:cytochrome P450